MKKGGNWTPELDAQLQLALQQKTSVQRLAVRFNISQGTIKARARALGFDLPTMPKPAQKINERPRWVAKKPR
jgi:hypothetical protein